MKELIAAVRKHAEANYETGGWDYIVESFEDDEIAEDIKGCKTTKEAIAQMGRIAQLLNDLREDIQGTVW